MPEIALAICNPIVENPLDLSFHTLLILAECLFFAQTVLTHKYCNYYRGHRLVWSVYFNSEYFDNLHIKPVNEFAISRIQNTLVLSFFFF